MEGQIRQKKKLSLIKKLLSVVIHSGKGKLVLCNVTVNHSLEQAQCPEVTGNTKHTHIFLLIFVLSWYFELFLLVLFFGLCVFYFLMENMNLGA